MARPVLPLVLVLSVACHGDNLQRPSLIPDQEVFWDLMLSHHAVTLSTAPGYDTLTVAATPRNARGEPLAGLPAPQYTSTDPNYVTVTPEGVIAAVKPTPTTLFIPIRVVATLTYNNLKHADTMFVRVVDEPNPAAHVLATLSIHPVPPDSAKRAATSDVPLAGTGRRPHDDDLFADSLRPRATAVGGASLPSPLFVHYRSADTTILIVGVGRIGPSSSRDVWDYTSERIYPKRPGITTIYASATVFGVTKADTLQFRVGAPIYDAIGVQGPAPYFLEASNAQHISEITIGTGGLVEFANDMILGPAPGVTPVPVDFMFDDAQVSNVISVSDSPFWSTYPVLFGSTYPDVCGFVAFDCGAGNIAPIDENVFNGIALRVFSAPGTYNFHSPLTGVIGRVIVDDER